MNIFSIAPTQQAGPSQQQQFVLLQAPSGQLQFPSQAQQQAPIQQTMVYHQPLFASNQQQMIITNQPAAYGNQTQSLQQAINSQNQAATQRQPNQLYIQQQVPLVPSSQHPQSSNTLTHQFHPSNDHFASSFSAHGPNFPSQTSVMQQQYQQCRNPNTATVAALTNDQNDRSLLAMQQNQYAQNERQYLINNIEEREKINDKDRGEQPVDGEDDSDDDGDDDVSNESVAEKKILKIDLRLNKNKLNIDKTQKRRLQNRKSALKCRLRKSHLIAALQAEVAQLKVDRQGLISEVMTLKERVKEEQLSNSALLVELTKLQALTKAQHQSNGNSSSAASGALHQTTGVGGTTQVTGPSTIGGAKNSSQMVAALQPHHVTLSLQQQQSMKNMDSSQQQNVLPIQVSTPALLAANGQIQRPQAQGIGMGQTVNIVTTNGSGNAVLQATPGTFHQLTLAQMPQPTVTQQQIQGGASQQVIGLNWQQTQQQSGRNYQQPQIIQARPTANAAGSYQILVNSQQQPANSPFQLHNGNASGIPQGGAPMGIAHTFIKASNNPTQIMTSMSMPQDQN